MIDLRLGDNLDILPSIPSQSVDCVITDPPYPHIKRDYGTWTTEEWRALMIEGVIPEVRRILKPTGSAVFILQPNSEHVGQMRGWLFEFQAWVCREWNMVQDVWWWNAVVLPSGGAATQGLLRASVKACVWAGASDCYRNQDAVLWSESLRNQQRRAEARANRQQMPSGHSVDVYKCTHAAVRRGGVTPFNMLPIPNSNSMSSAGSKGHGAGTPLKLADWWTRYICPPGGTVLDPFDGVGTMMLAALQNGCNGIGIERDAGYHEIARQRIEEAQAKHIQLELEATQ